jgi:Flp pilus assembly protein TadG
MGSKLRRRERRGAAAVEFAIVLLLLLTLLLGVLEVGRLLYVQMVLENAVGVGGRQASVGVSTNEQVQQAVANYLKFAGISTLHATVTVTNLTSSSTDASEAAQLDRLQVTVTVPFTDVRLTTTTFFTSDSTALSATAIFPSARDVPYPTNIQSPPGH